MLDRSRLSSWFEKKAIQDVYIEINIIGKHPKHQTLNKMYVMGLSETSNLDKNAININLVAFIYCGVLK